MEKFIVILIVLILLIILYLNIRTKLRGKCKNCGCKTTQAYCWYCEIGINK